MGKENGCVRAALCHISGVIGSFVGVALLNIFIPLILWLVWRKQYPFVNEHGREAVNFQITWTIYLAASGFLCLIFVGIPLLAVFGIMYFYCAIKAAIKASNGEFYRYPITIRFFK